MSSSPFNGPWSRLVTQFRNEKADTKRWSTIAQAKSGLWCMEESGGWLQAQYSVQHEDPGTDRQTQHRPGFPTVHPWWLYRQLLLTCSLTRLPGLITDMERVNVNQWRSSEVDALGQGRIASFSPVCGKHFRWQCPCSCHTTGRKARFWYLLSLCAQTIWMNI